MNLLSSLLNYVAEQIAALRTADSTASGDITALGNRVTTAEGDIDSLEAQFTTVVSAVTTDTEVTNIRVGADGLTDSTAGASTRRQFNDVDDIDDSLYGAKSTVSLTELTGKIVNSSGQIVNGSGYKVFRFPLQPNKSYVIKAVKNEVLRLGLDDSDDTDARGLGGVITSTDTSKLNFTNTEKYQYGFLFGVTPGYTSASFSVKVRESGIDDSVDELVEQSAIVDTLNETMFGPIEDVTTTEHTSKLISGEREKYENAVSTYSTFVFPMEKGKKYVIRAMNNEVLRFGASDLDGSTEHALYDVVTSGDLNYYEYVNEKGYAYGYVFGVTLSYPRALFTVQSVDLTDSLINDLSALDNIPQVGDYKEYIDDGIKRFTDGQILSNLNGAFSLKSLGINTYLNLGHFDANSSLYNINNVISSDSNVFNDGDVIAVNVEIDVSSNSFEQLAVGLKTPNTSTTKIAFFNISASDLDDGHFSFSRLFKTEVNSAFSVPFIYVYDESISGVNPLTITGSISVAKYQQTTDHMQVDGLTYYFKERNDMNESAVFRGNVKTVGKLHKNGINIVDADETPVELRGVGLHALLQYPHLHMRKTLESLRYMGCNMVRVSVYLQDNYFNSSDGEIAYGYLSHPDESKKEIERIIHNCIDLGLYVLLDWHHWYETDGRVLSYLTDAKEFFEYFTEKYANVPNLLYEITNEPYNDNVADLVTFVSEIRDIIVDNVETPIMVTGCTYDGYNTWKDRCNALYSALSSAGITDVFISPHNYGGGLYTEVNTLIANSVPTFVTEWGNSTSTGDGAGNDTAALAQINSFHTNCVPQSLWKFTDQTMTSSLLSNQGVINSEKYLFGFGWADLSHNGSLLLGKYYDYVRDEWIERSPLN